MQSEDVLGATLQTAEHAPAKTRSKKTNLLIAVQSTAFILGLGILVGVMYWLGYRGILESLSRIGWGFLPIIALNVIRHLLRALTLYLAVPADQRNFKFRSAVAARFGGEAIGFLTITGPFLGDATKAVLLKKHITLTHSASAVLIDNALYYLSVLLLILAGVGGYVYNFGSSTPDRGVLWAIAVSAGVIVFASILSVLLRVTPLSQLIKTLAAYGIAPKFVLKMQQSILNVETNVVQFYHERRGDLFTLFSINWLVHIVSICEVYLALRLLGFDALWSTAFIIESLTKVINIIFSFVPGTIGVYEGGNSVILLSLGYTALVGIELALVRRVAIMFSLFVGLVILLWRTVGRGAKTLVRPSEEPLF